MAPFVLKRSLQNSIKTLVKTGGGELGVGRQKRGEVAAAQYGLYIGADSEPHFKLIAHIKLVGNACFELVGIRKVAVDDGIAERLALEGNKWKVYMALGVGEGGSQGVVDGGLVVGALKQKGGDELCFAHNRNMF